jgi:transcriptional regulator with XRE-family HTH domain
MARVSKTRIPVDDSPLARQIGDRLKKARLAAGLTQQKLAEPRYTKAYVSALENGLSRPSMVSLNFFAARLGIPASRLINDEPPVWARIEADLALASGRWDDAIDGYRNLIEVTPALEHKAELMRGLAEALVRRGQDKEATTNAAAAARVFHDCGREADAALAEYWLSAAQYALENTVEAKAILQSILVRVRNGLRVEPDFQVRLLMALSSNESRDGNHAAALAYLEEVRGLAADLDDRRRAAYLYDLAYSYRETGDFEAAVRTGIASLELYKRTEAEREAAALENDLALSYLALGNTSRASELATSSRKALERLGDEWWLAHAVDTEARIALVRGETQDAAHASERALALAERTGNVKAAIDALLTTARVRTALGQMPAALQAAERAAKMAKEAGGPALVRRTLREWADTLAASGDHERAFAVMREALAP